MDITIDLLKKIEEIASFLDMSQCLQDIQKIEKRLNADKSPILLPLVGEFSSGKTSLLNALTDTKKLETATKPTTATIYEVHFGTEKASATVVADNGELRNYQDIADVRNDEVSDAKVVTIFDTSTKISSETILVDTPGLSSPDPKHKQTLVEFLPMADAILLVVDINQQVTRSLTDFVSTLQLSKKTIYLVITKGDTKSSTDKESAKKYICENCKFSIEDMVCVSAQKNDLQEFYYLLDKIEKKKKEIIMRADQDRVNNIICMLSDRCSEILNAADSLKDLENAIYQQDFALRKIAHNIKVVIDDAKEQIEQAGIKSYRKFEDCMLERLSNLVVSQKDNFDDAAISLINTTSTLILDEYKSRVHEILGEQVKNNKDGGIPMEALNQLDLERFSVSGLSYDLCLDEIGHEYDSKIAMGIKIAGVAAIAVATAGTGSAAAGALTAGTGSAAVTAGQAIDVATDVVNIRSNVKLMNKVQKYANYVQKVKTGYDTVKSVAKPSEKKGMIDSMVGFVTEQCWGKPQRKRAVRKYLDETLQPQFKRAVNDITQNIIACVSKELEASSSAIISEKQNLLSEMQKEYNDNKEAHQKRKKQINEYKDYLLTLK